MDRRERGISRFSVYIFSSRSFQKTLWVNSSMFQNVLGIDKNFLLPKKGISKFSMKIFCLTVPKSFGGEPWYRNKSWIGGGRYQDFPSENCSLTVSKCFIRETFCAVFQKFSGSEKSLRLAEGGMEYHVFSSKLLSHRAE